MIIFIYGLPGCGKGTQSLLLKERMSFIHLSTGDIIRDIIKNKKAGWEVLNKYSSSGSLVPDEIVNDLFMRAIDEKGYGHNYIIDGYPRTINQLKLIEKNLEDKKDIDILHIYLSCSEESIIRRITSRRTCMGCGTIYNINLDNDLEKCKLCGAQLYQRADDSYEVIKNRIDEYTNKTIPVILQLKSEGKLIEINGERKAEDIYVDIVNIIKGKR